MIPIRATARAATTTNMSLATTIPATEIKSDQQQCFPEKARHMIHTTTLCRFGILLRTLIFSLGAVVALAQTGLAQSVPNVSGTMPPVIIIGFVGGFIKHDNLVHSEVLSHCFVLLDLLKKDVKRLGPPATKLQSRTGSFGAARFLSALVFEQAEQSAQH